MVSISMRVNLWQCKCILMLLFIAIWLFAFPFSTSYSVETLLYNCIDADTTYTLIDNLLKIHSEWSPTKPYFHHSDIARKFSKFAKVLPTTDEESRMLRQKKKITPPRQSLTVIKRLYDEGKAFKKLPSHLSHFILKEDETFYFDEKVHATICRLLYRLFPALLADHRATIGSKWYLWYMSFLLLLTCTILPSELLVLDFKKRAKAVKESTCVAIDFLHQCLWDALMELELTQQQLKDILDENNCFLPADIATRCK